MQFLKSPLLEFQMRMGILSLLLTVFVLNVNAQNITMSNNGNGVHSFSSPYQFSDMHFYLYGDGHHSFKANHLHQFDNTSTYTPKVYHAVPYDDINPVGLSLGPTSGGVNSPTVSPKEINGKIELKRSWNLVNGNKNFFILMLQNTSTTQTWSGCVEFHYDDEKTEITPGKIKDEFGNGWFGNREDEPSIYAGFTNMHRWDFDNLEAGEQRFIYIPASCGAQSFSKVNTLAILNTECHDNEIELEDNENVHNYSSIVSNFPYDPNIIRSDCDHYDRNTATVRYRLYFQNEGNDPVEDVDIDFFTNGKYTNVKLLQSSHPCTLTWSPYSPGVGSVQNKCAELLFEKIFLPGLNQQNPRPQSYISTIGWADILVCYNNITNTCIRTEMDVYFDDLPEVSFGQKICNVQNSGTTNISCSKRRCPARAPFTQSKPGGGAISSRENEGITDEKLTLSLYPNPATETIYLDGIGLSTDTNISILDMHGRVLKVNIPYNDQIDISTLNQGVYNLVFQNDTEIKVKQFVKI